MSTPLHIDFRLSAQRALLGHVGPSLRSVSLAIDEPERSWTMSFVFDGSQTESELEAARIAITEVLSDFPDWSETVEFQFLSPPTRIPQLDWIVFERIEGD